MALRTHRGRIFVATFLLSAAVLAFTSWTDCLQLLALCALALYFDLKHQRRTEEIKDRQDKNEALVQQITNVLRAAETRRIRSTKERDTL